MEENTKSENVKWKTLKEICKISTGKLNANAKVENGEYPFFTCQKVPNKIDKYSFDTEAVLMAGNGNVGNVHYYSGKFDAYQRTYIIETLEVNVKFLYYYLKTFFKGYIENYKKEGIISYITLPVLEKFLVTLPPLKKQEEIAAVLDKFTELTEELTEELTAREAQYNYYRDMLLSEDYLNKTSKTNDSSNNNQIRFTTLGEVAQINRGASPRPISNFLTDNESGIAWIKIGDIEANSKYVTKTVQKITFEGAQKSRILKKGDFIISNSMSYGRPYILKIDGAIHDGWASISNFENHLDSDFLYHFLNSSMVKNYWKRKINGSLVSNLNSEIICSLPIIIVDKKLQKKIAQKLDKFQSLLSNTQGLLPKEIKLRQKQYEYYREKLLTF